LNRYPPPGRADGGFIRKEFGELWGCPPEIQFPLVVVVTVGVLELAVGTADEVMPSLGVGEDEWIPGAIGIDPVLPVQGEKPVIIAKGIITEEDPLAGMIVPSVIIELPEVAHPVGDG
jgi:hypothetical protein